MKALVYWLALGLILGAAIGLNDYAHLEEFSGSLKEAKKFALLCGIAGIVMGVSLLHGIYRGEYEIYHLAFLLSGMLSAGVLSLVDDYSSRGFEAVDFIGVIFFGFGLGITIGSAAYYGVASLLNKKNQ